MKLINIFLLILILQENSSTKLKIDKKVMKNTAVIAMGTLIVTTKITVNKLTVRMA